MVDQVGRILFLKQEDQFQRGGNIHHLTPINNKIKLSKFKPNHSHSNYIYKKKPKLYKTFPKNVT